MPARYPDKQRQRRRSRRVLRRHDQGLHATKADRARERNLARQDRARAKRIRHGAEHAEYLEALADWRLVLEAITDGLGDALVEALRR